MLTVERTDLLKAMELLTRVAKRHQTIPILSYVRIHSVDGRLALSATDLENYLTIVVPHQGDDEIDVCVSASTLRTVARSARGPIEIVPLKSYGAGERLGIRTGAVTANLGHMPSADFPTKEMGEDHHVLELPAADLQRTLLRASVAISSEETRYYLNGIYMHGHEGRLRLVATDGHRLILDSFEMPGADQVKGFIVPRDSVTLVISLLARHKGTVQFQSSINPILGKFIFGDTSLTFKFIDGTFPDYSRVIPKDDTLPNIFSMETAGLRESIKLVKRFASERGGVVAIEMCQDAPCHLRVKNRDFDSDISIAIDANYTGKAMVRGFQARYLVDALAHIYGTAKFHYSDAETSPMVIKASDAPDWLGVVMPMRI